MEELEMEMKKLIVAVVIIAIIDWAGASLEFRVRPKFDRL